jgi:Mg-chelatase subunit ChlI
MTTKREKVGNIDIETAQKLIKTHCCFFNVVGSSCPFYPDNGCFAYDEEDIRRKPCLHFGVCIYSLMIEDRKVRNEFIKTLLKKCEERKLLITKQKKEKHTNVKTKKDKSENKRKSSEKRKGRKDIRNNRTSKNTKSARGNSKRLSSDTSTNRRRGRKSSK